MSVVEENYSQKFDTASSSPKSRGAYFQEDATKKGLALVEAKFKDMKLYWMVDVVEDRVYSGKFFAYGGKVSVAICETLCAMVKGLTIPEAVSLLGTDVERELRDDPDIPAVPESKMASFSNVDNILKIIEKDYPAAKAVAQASTAIKDSGAKPTKSAKELTMVDQAWLGLSEADQIAQIELVLDAKIRPALLADGGNVKVMEVNDGEKVIVQYQGACGSCGSSTGATLSFMENALRQDVYDGLYVVPQM
jgi:NifU-like protein